VGVFFFFFFFFFYFFLVSSIFFYFFIYLSFIFSMRIGLGNGQLALSRADAHLIGKSEHPIVCYIKRDDLFCANFKIITPSALADI